MRRTTRLLILLAYTVCVAIVMVLPAPNLHDLPFPGFDKIVHVCLFGGLGGLGVWSVSGQVAAVAIGGMVFGLATELTQRLVPTRQFDLLDLAADAAGVLLGIGVWLICSAWSRRQAWRRTDL
jgi:VanZ family protein